MYNYRFNHKNTTTVLKVSILKIKKLIKYNNQKCLTSKLFY